MQTTKEDVKYLLLESIEFKSDYDRYYQITAIDLYSQKRVLKPVVERSHKIDAERSFTLLPDEEPPIKKLYALPFVLFIGLSRLLNNPLNTPIHIPPNFLYQKSTYCN